MPDEPFYLFNCSQVHFFGERRRPNVTNFHEKNKKKLVILLVFDRFIDAQFIFHMSKNYMVAFQSVLAVHITNKKALGEKKKKKRKHLVTGPAFSTDMMLGPAGFTMRFPSSS